MNVPLTPPPTAVARHKITLAEARRMWDAGVFPDYPDLELIDGELYEMPSDGVVTISWNAAVNRRLIASLDDQYVIVSDKTLKVAETSGPKPDFYVYPASIPLAQVSAANVLLVIEISDSTLEHDRDTKAPLYEQGGVQDYWIVDCQKRRVLVFRSRADGKFGEPATFEADRPVEARLIPGLALRLDDIHLPA
jgi:Uma2 family endonuclease